MAKSLDAQLKVILEDYALGVRNGVEEVAEKVTKKGLETLKSTSPKDRPKYYSGWKVTQQMLGLTNTYILHNAKYPGLTHLTEKGHATVDGDRTTAKPHIEPVEQQMNQEFEQGVIRLIENS